MNILKYRPLCLATIFFVLAGFLCLYLTLFGKIVFACIFLGVGILFFILRKRKGLTAAYIVAMALCVVQCALSCLSVNLPLYRAEKFDEGTFTTTAYVVNVLYEGDNYYLFQIKTEVVGDEEYAMSVCLSHDQPMEPGQSFTADLTYTLYSNETISENSYSFSSGMIGDAVISSEVTFGDSVLTPTIAATHCRNAICDFFDRTFDKDAAALMRAMVLGDRSGLSAQTSLNFHRTGITHLLALSGMHITILIMVLQKVFSFVRIPKRIATPAIMVIVVLYSFLVGMPLSIMRATGMSLVLLAGTMIRRERDALTALSFAVLAILTISPLSILDIGFWLSVTSTLGILICTEYHIGYIAPTTLWRKILQSFISALIMTLSASLFTLPIVAFFFGEISLLSLPANLIFPPLMNPLIYLGLIAIPIPILRHVTNFASTAYLRLLSWVSGTRGVMVSMEPTFFRVMLILTIAALLLVLLAKLPRPKLFLIPVGVLACAMIVSALIPHIRQENQISLTYSSDIAKNDCLVLRNEGYTVVYLSSYLSSYYLHQLEYNLFDGGVREIDLLCFSHYHEGLPSYLEELSGDVLVRAIALPPTYTSEEERLAQDARLAADGLNIPVRELAPDTPLSVGETVITALPRTLTDEDGSHARVAATFALGKKSIYYASAGYYHAFPYSQVEATLEDLSCNILVFGGHGNDAARELPPVYPIDEHVTHIYLCSGHERPAMTAEEHKLFESRNMWVTRVEDYFFLSFDP